MGELLDSEDVSFKQLTKLATTKLENMGLSVGVAMRLKDHIKRYIERAQIQEDHSSEDSRPRSASNA